MIRHSNSFLLSLILHSLILGAIFFSFDFFSSIKSAPKKEKILCINLQCVSKRREEVKSSQVKKVVPIHKKIRKKHLDVKKKIVKLHEKKNQNKEIQKIEKEVVPTIIKKRKNTPEKEIQKSSLDIPRNLHMTKEQQYLQNHLNEIAQLIQENLYYPRRARKKGLEGEVIVRFNLSIEGKVTSLKILSCSYDILGRAALQSIQNIISQLPKPAQNITLSIPIQYKLK